MCAAAYASDDFEADPQGLHVGIAMSGLRKVYTSGVVAVDTLTVKFYEGQITSFLGHNGAGKTTTLFVVATVYYWLRHAAD
jgi:ATP-binding cassette subfamily A (ABC1) protein 1